MSRPSPYLSVSSLDELLSANHTLYASGYSVGGRSDVDALAAELKGIYLKRGDDDRVRAVWTEGKMIRYQWDHSVPLDVSSMTIVNSANHLIRYLRAAP